MSSILKSYKKYIKILVVFAISFLLMRSLLLFDYINELSPNRNFREVMNNIERSLSSSTMMRFVFHTHVGYTIGCFIAILTLLIHLLAINELSICRIHSITVKPTKHMEALELSNPFLYANKTRSLRE